MLLFYTYYDIFIKRLSIRLDILRHNYKVIKVIKPMYAHLFLSNYFPIDFISVNGKDKPRMGPDGKEVSVLKQLIGMNDYVRNRSVKHFSYKL